MHLYKFSHPSKFCLHEKQYDLMGDPNMANLKKGDIIQLERRGYFIVDQTQDLTNDKKLVLFNIPDGRLQSH